MSRPALQVISQIDRTSSERHKVAAGVRRVAHLLLWPNIGGGEIATLRVVEALEKGDEYQNIAFCHEGNTEVARLFDKHGIETTDYQSADFSYRHPAPFITSALALAAKFRQHSVDLVHCSDLHGAYHAGLAARLARIPIICHVRSNFVQIPARYKPPLFTVNRFIFVSQSTWNNLNTIFRVPPNRGSVVYDWAPTSSQTIDAVNERSRVRRELGIEPTTPVIGMVARVAPQKDFETLICATARVLTAQPDARLLLVGDNQEPAECKKYYNQLCRLAGALGIERHVIWTGFRSDVPALMSAMDVSVLATRSEGFPLTLLEAMSLGRPVVTARVGGIPEMIADGENGLLYEAGDVEGLSNQIIRLLNDVNLRERIRQRGRESVLSRFTKEKTIDQIKRVYSGLLNRSDRQSNVRRPKGIE